MEPVLSPNYQPGEMLARLTESLAALPDVLARRAAWDSLIVNRRKPHTYRVFTTLPSGLRLCLHRFDPCHSHEAFPHPHPWPGAFAVLRGRYRMAVGYAPNRHDAPADVTTLELSAGSCYEIVNALTWHAVVPLETTYTVMVNGAPWDLATTAHVAVRTTRGKDLDRMPEPELLDHLALFRELVREWADRRPRSAGYGS